MVPAAIAMSYCKVVCLEESAMADLREQSAIVQLKIRLRESLRARLEEEARFHGRSINSQVVACLERNYERQDLMIEMLGLTHGAHLAGMLMILGSVMEQVGYLHANSKGSLSASGTGRRWAEDPAAFDQAALAAVAFLMAARPTSSMTLTDRSYRIVRDMISAIRHDRDRPIPFTRTAVKVRSLLGPIANWLSVKKLPDPKRRIRRLHDAGLAIADRMNRLLQSSVRGDWRLLDSSRNTGISSGY